jgi:hypothetical protein
MESEEEEENKPDSKILKTGHYNHRSIYKSQFGVNSNLLIKIIFEYFQLSKHLLNLLNNKLLGSINK